MITAIGTAPNFPCSEAGRRFIRIETRSICSEINDNKPKIFKEKRK